MYHHAIRITLPYDDCKVIIAQWANRSTRAIVYQHDADETVRQTHVHLALYGCDVQSQQLKNMWKDAPGKGNQFWSWKEADEASRYLTYASKGKYAPKFVKNFSEQEVEKARQDWVEPVKADKPGDSSEKIVIKIMSKFNIKTDRGYYRDEDEIELGECKYNLELLLENVRSVSFRQLWGERRMVPHASHYKIIASTVFLRLCEDANCFEQGSKLIRNLWY